MGGAVSVSMHTYNLKGVVQQPQYGKERERGFVRKGLRGLCKHADSGTMVGKLDTLRINGPRSQFYNT